MKKTDRQHFVTQGYLRNFSPDMVIYLEKRKDETDRQRKKRRERMKIYYYDIQRNKLGFGKINTLAIEDRYFPKEVDKKIQPIEFNLGILREIIGRGKEEFLYTGDNQQILREIVNCFRSKSRTFREIISEYQTNFLEKWPLNNAGRVFLEHTKDVPELFQTLYFTNDPNTVLKKSWVSFRKSKTLGSDDKEYEITKPEESKKLEKALIRLNKQNMVPKNVYPILINNCTNIPFITGDDSVIAIRFKIKNVRKSMYNYYFPISPKFAIGFLCDKKFSPFFMRNVVEDYEIHKMNRLMYHCSRFFLFANEKRVLEQTTLVPKGLSILDICHAHQWKTLSSF